MELIAMPGGYIVMPCGMEKVEEECGKKTCHEDARGKNPGTVFFYDRKGYL